MEKTILNIAGYRIALIFHPSDKRMLKETEIKEKIIKCYLNFILEKVNKKVDFQIDFIQKYQYEILSRKTLREHYINFYEEKAKNRITTYYHISFPQLQIIIRRALQNLLAKDKGILIHASASLINNSAFLFLGKSGSGKSTAVKLISPDFSPLADDTAILKKEGEKYYIYQTPFQEKNYAIIRKSQRIKLGMIFFIKKAPFFKLEKIRNKKTIAKEIIQQLFIEDNDTRNHVKNVLNFVSEFKDFNYLYFARSNREIMIELFKTHGKIQS